jgi:hypothetical protein
LTDISSSIPGQKVRIVDENKSKEYFASGQTDFFEKGEYVSSNFENKNDKIKLENGDEIEVKSKNVYLIHDKESKIATRNFFI